MRLVPRQLRRSDIAGAVPYYGGRLTPDVIAGLGRPPGSPPPLRTTPQPPGTVPPREVPVPGDREQHLAALRQLRDEGVLTEAEYEAAARRLGVA